MVCFNFIKRFFLGEPVHPDYVRVKWGEHCSMYSEILDDFYPLKKYCDHRVYKSCTIFEYSCENESQRLLKAKKIIKDYIHIFVQLTVVNNQITINVGFSKFMSKG